MSLNFYAVKVFLVDNCLSECYSEGSNAMEAFENAVSENRLVLPPDESEVDISVISGSGLVIRFSAIKYN